MERFGFIYMAEDSVFNRKYIGQSTTKLETRKSNHKKSAYNKLSTNYNLLFYKMIRFIGFENFKWTILEKNIPVIDLNRKEKEYIEKYDSFNEGYNSSPGIKTDKLINNENGISEKVIDNVIECLKKNKDMNLNDISNKFGISKSSVSDINNGDIYFQQNIDYPIRKTNTKHKLTNKDILIIYSDLKELNSIKNVAKKWNLNPNTVRNINLGNIHKKENIEYPIVNFNIKTNTTDYLEQYLKFY
jgi:hypothetical protein